MKQLCRNKERIVSERVLMIQYQRCCACIWNSIGVKLHCTSWFIV